MSVGEECEACEAKKIIPVKQLGKCSTDLIHKIPYFKLCIESDSVIVLFINHQARGNPEVADDSSVTM